ncbi:MAG TPA: integrin alpha, partial [Planctomycetota bacterium]|nr:integrin alpha [Planctomycetota bacterium]
APVPGIGIAGRVALHSGATGAPLALVDGTTPLLRFGRSVARAGDIDGDAVADFVVGAPRELSSAATSGYASVHSGATGAVLFTLASTAPGDQFGAALEGDVDLDGDSVPDLLVGSPGGYALTTPCRVEVFSGATGARLSAFSGVALGDGFGRSIAIAMDPLGDGLPDLLVGATALTGGYVQRVSMVGTPPGTTRFGSGCVGTGGFAPSIAAFGGTPTAGNADFGIAITRGRGGAGAVLFAGLAAGPGGGGCAPLLSGTTFPVSPVLAMGGIFPVPGAGYRLYGVPIPSNPTLVGATLYFQWAAGDPASPNGLFTTTDALSVTVQ